ncbi:MAG: AMP-binding protein, partial [Actinomycetota bacterium]
MGDPSPENISALLDEQRVLEPPEAFRKNAVVASDGIYGETEEDPEAFWAAQAERLEWFAPWDRVLEQDHPWVRWFTGGRLNVTHNCVDRHVAAGLGERIAYHWEGEPEGETETLTYADLQQDVVRTANLLRSLGVGKGTPVGIYMGMIPKLPIAMLACARLGAPHTVVFGGFAADSLADRLNDMGCKVLITQDEGWRRGQRVPLKQNADRALESAPSVKTALVSRRTGGDVAMREGRDLWWEDAWTQQSEDPSTCPPEPMDAEDLLYLLYTSGTTGKPKGIAHTTGGYLVGTSATHRMIFDLRPETDVYWCAADVGWVTGHSYIVYGPLANATTGVLYEGAPDFPDKDRFWSIVERYGVTILYTAPTAIRAFMK